MHEPKTNDENGDKSLLCGYPKASVALVYNYDFNLYRFSSAIIEELLAMGHRVYGIAPRGEYAPKLEQMGVKFLDWHIDPNSMNPAAELISFLSLLRILRKIRPAVCNSFTIKPNIYATIAARVSGVPAIISSYTGLGHLFNEYNHPGR